GILIAALLYWRGGAATSANTEEVLPPSNPLEIQTALVFAVLFIALSVGVGWARTEFGAESLFVLAAFAGFTDVDPLVLSVAQEAQGTSPLAASAAAILIAAASNNVLKGVYTLSFAGRAAGIVPALALLFLALVGIAAAFITLSLA
ncbi:MAG TPA: hypothetical protein DHK64_11490, partial [Rhodobiaceae bacterium]|nr:hypothetical protein [Rhodobiaceae bacterium]